MTKAAGIIDKQELSMKQCIKCKQQLNEGCFYKDVSRKDGLTNWCKSCVKNHRKDYYQTYCEEIKIRCNAYFQKHRKEILPCMKAYSKIYIQKNYHRRAWSSMICRCTDIRHISHKNYGGRGITVCQRWLDSFEDFKKDMGERPSPEHSIDRINNNGNYEPSNCKWSTMKEQNSNKRVRGR